jgi:hypothetical protein
MSDEVEAGDERGNQPVFDLPFICTPYICLFVHLFISSSFSIILFRCLQKAG